MSSKSVPVIVTGGDTDDDSNMPVSPSQEGGYEPAEEMTDRFDDVEDNDKNKNKKKLEESTTTAPLKNMSKKPGLVKRPQSMPSDSANLGRRKSFRTVGKLVGSTNWLRGLVSKKKKETY